MSAIYNYTAAFYLLDAKKGSMGGIFHPSHGQLVAFEPAERITGRSLAIIRVDGARPVKLITHLMKDHMATAHLSGSLELAEHFTLSRMDYGAMQLAGPGVWGPPRNRGEAITVLREAAEGLPQPKGQNHPLLTAPHSSPQGRALAAAVGGAPDPLSRQLGLVDPRRRRHRRPGSLLG